MHPLPGELPLVQQLQLLLRVYREHVVKSRWNVCQLRATLYHVRERHLLLHLRIKVLYVQWYMCKLSSEL